jgi:hypothetical protein
MARSAADDYAALQSADVLPPATRVVAAGEGGSGASGGGGGAPTRFTATFYPHPHLWIDRPVVYDFRIPMSYPALPPIVACADADFVAASAARASLDPATGRVTVGVLTMETMGGWMRMYTLADAVHCVRRTLMRSGPLVNVVTGLGEPAYGSFVHAGGMSSSDASSSAAGPNSPSQPLQPASPPAGAPGDGSGANARVGAPSGPAPSFAQTALVALRSGHHGLQGRRPTMEDAAAWFDQLPVGECGWVPPASEAALVSG